MNANPIDINLNNNKKGFKLQLKTHIVFFYFILVFFLFHIVGPYCALLFLYASCCSFHIPLCACYYSSPCLVLFLFMLDVVPFCDCCYPFHFVVFLCACCCFFSHYYFSLCLLLLLFCMLLLLLCACYYSSLCLLLFLRYMLLCYCSSLHLLLLLFVLVVVHLRTCYCSSSHLLLLLSHFVAIPFHIFFCSLCCFPL